MRYDTIKRKPWERKKEVVALFGRGLRDAGLSPDALLVKSDPNYEYRLYYEGLDFGRYCSRNRVFSYGVPNRELCLEGLEAGKFEAVLAEAVRARCDEAGPEGPRVTARKPRESRRHTGFGLELSVAEWAERSGIPSSTIYRELATGLNMEHIFKLHGAVLDHPEKASRKVRASAQMDDTRLKMYILLTMSGYTMDKSLEDVEVTARNNATHLVRFCGSTIGQYHFRKGGLRLSSGEGLPLDKIEPDQARIVWKKGSGWEVHPETRRELHRRLREGKV